MAAWKHSVSAARIFRRQLKAAKERNGLPLSESIYHGSNTIYREYLSESGRIMGEAALKPGMAVFKWNSNTPEKAQ